MEITCDVNSFTQAGCLCNLPGQPPLLHSPVSLSGPSCEQSFPPGLGEGLVQERVRVWRPSPQVAEHSDQAPHSE